MDLIGARHSFSDLAERWHFEDLEELLELVGGGATQLPLRHAHPRGQRRERVHAAAAGPPLHGSACRPTHAPGVVNQGRPRRRQREAHNEWTAAVTAAGTDAKRATAADSALLGRRRAAEGESPRREGAQETARAT
jgi:hypothetical protein